MTVELDRISKDYDRPVLRNFSYTFESGKLYIVKGVSGCGKTTLLNIIGGIDKASSGVIHGNYSCGYLFQSSLLLSRLTVWENLVLINNSPHKIESLGLQLGIHSLYEKYPDQLSGGERQRVSIVRALLQSPCVLLADEPTASLDCDNSNNIARLISSLKDENRVIIIATHDHYFDAYADEIIHLNYGTIDNIEYIDPIHSSPVSPIDIQIKKRSVRITPFQYAKKRNPHLFKTTGLIPLVLAFLLVLVVFTLQNNFSNEYLRIIRNRYPMDMIVFNQSELDRFTYSENLTLYYNYTAQDGEVRAYRLLPQKDSVLSISGMICYGSFPSNDFEILITKDFADSFLDSDGDYSSCLGKSVLFKNISLTISGVLADLSNRTVKYNMYADPCYQHQDMSNSIFIMYDKLATIGDRQESPYIIGIYDNLLDDADAYHELERALNGNPNQFYSDIKANQKELDALSYLFTAILFVSFFTACIFMITIIKTELFYRRKEIGYLQIFGLGKSSVRRLVIAEYRLILFASLVISFILYAVIIFVYFLITGSLILPNIIITLSVLSVLSFVYYTSAYKGVSSFLQRTIVSLIT